MKRNRLMIITFVGPALLTFLMVYLYPTVRTALMSFFYVKNVTDKMAVWEYVGIENYIKLFNSGIFITSLNNIFFIWLLGGIGVFAIAMLFSVILTSGARGKSFFRAVIYLPNVVSAVALATMWIQYVYSGKYGLLKFVFESLGLKQLAEVQWTSPDLLFLSMLIAYSFGMVGYFLLIFMAGIEKIPKDLYEAATIDGADIIKKFLHITIPLMREVFKTSIVLWTISIAGFFIWSQMFSPLTPDPGTISPMVYMYNIVFGRNLSVTDPSLINAGAGAAVGVILMLLVVFIFGLTSFIFKKDRLEY